jgi:predicted metal-dependent phosphoesterase TrpH
MYDLHFHTTLSDGADSSERMVNAAISREARLLSCTDHDIVNREVGKLVDAFNVRTEDRIFRKPPRIDLVE